MQPLAPPVPATDAPLSMGAIAAESFDFAFDATAFAANVPPNACAPANPQPAAVGSPIGSDAAAADSHPSTPEVSGSTSPHSFSLKKPSGSEAPSMLKLEPDQTTEEMKNASDAFALSAPNPNAAPFTPTPPSPCDPNSPPAYNPDNNTTATTEGAAVPNQPAPPATRTNVYIAWLPRSFLENDLLNLVAPFGDIVSVRLVQDASRSYAFVLYESREAAEGALVGLNTTRVNGRRLQARISSAHDGNRGPKPLGAGPNVATMMPPPPPFGAMPMHMMNTGAPMMQQHQPQPQQLVMLQPQQQQLQPQLQQQPQVPMMLQPQQQQPQQQEPMVLIQVPGSQMYQQVPLSQLQQVQQAPQQQAPQQQRQQQQQFVIQQAPQQQQQQFVIQQAPQQHGTVPMLVQQPPQQMQQAPQWMQRQ